MNGRQAGNGAIPLPEICREALPAFPGDLDPGILNKSHAGPRAGGPLPTGRAAMLLPAGYVLLKETRHPFGRP